MGLQLFDPHGFLVLEQPVVHLPVLALVAGAVRRLGRLARVGVNLVDRKVPEDVTQLAGLHVLGLQGRQCRIEEALAVGALVVGELDQGDRRVGAAQDGIVVDADARRGRSGRPTGAPRQQVANRLELVPEHLELGPDRLQVGLGGRLRLRLRGRRASREGQACEHRQRRQNRRRSLALQHHGVSLPPTSSRNVRPVRRQPR